MLESHFLFYVFVKIKKIRKKKFIKKLLKKKRKKRRRRRRVKPKALGILAIFVLNAFMCKGLNNQVECLIRWDIINKTCGREQG